MKFIHFCLFTLIYQYSPIISAPINQTVSIVQETAHSNAAAVAGRLLMELADEQSFNKEPQRTGSDIFGNKNYIGYLLTTDDLNNKGSSSKIIDVNGILVDNEQELMKYLKNLQNVHPHSMPPVDFPIMNENVMIADDPKQ